METKTEVQTQEQLDAIEIVNSLFEKYQFQEVANCIHYIKIYAKEELRRKENELESKLSTIREILENI